jgi:hypothetical protein
MREVYKRVIKTVATAFKTYDMSYFMAFSKIDHCFRGADWIRHCFDRYDHAEKGVSVSDRADERSKHRNYFLLLL